MRQPRTLCCFCLYYLLEDYHSHKEEFQLQNFFIKFKLRLKLEKFAL
jgi:hypothetical protein